MRTLLELIAAVHGVSDLPAFRSDLLAALQRAVPSDWISINDIGTAPGDVITMVEPTLSAAEMSAWAQMAPENPLIIRWERTRDGRAYRFSDVVSASELHGLRIYQEFYAPMGVEHQMAFTLPSDADRLLGVALSRRHADFTDAERDLLDQARPFLIQSYRDAIERDALTSALERHIAGVADAELNRRLRGRGLTGRECDVARQIARGASVGAIGRRLGLSERTVHKHLEHIEGKLEVHTRWDVAEVVWSLAGLPATGG